MTCCITQRNLKLLYDYELMNSQKLKILPPIPTGSKYILPLIPIGFHHLKDKPEKSVMFVMFPNHFSRFVVICIQLILLVCSYMYPNDSSLF